MTMIEIPTEFSDEDVEQQAHEQPRRPSSHGGTAAEQDGHVEGGSAVLGAQPVTTAMATSSSVSLTELIRIGLYAQDRVGGGLTSSVEGRVRVPITVPTDQFLAPVVTPDGYGAGASSASGELTDQGPGSHGHGHLFPEAELAEAGGHTDGSHKTVMGHGGPGGHGFPEAISREPTAKHCTELTATHSPPHEVIKAQDHQRSSRTSVCNRGTNTDTSASNAPSPLRSFSPPPSSWQLKEGGDKDNSHGIVSAPPSAATTPLRSPITKVLKSTRQCLEEIGHFTTLNPRDAWLPVTESRNGNAWYAGFHNMNAALGFQAILLPVAFTALGWERGIFALSVAFAWQMYTIWLLIHMHECIPGKRYNRYLELCQAAFGQRLGLVIGIPIIFQLTVGTSTALIGIGGSSLKLFYLTLCPSCTNPFSFIAWYLIFAFVCALVAQLPNLNSIAGVSLIGAVMAVGYLTTVWVLSVSTPLASNVKVTYNVRTPGGALADSFSVLNALGIIAFAFRGHNLVPEIQATMPSTLKHPASVPMWRGARAAYILVALCYFPVAIGGYCAYGDLMNPQGILTSLFEFHRTNISRTVLGATYLFVVLSSVSSFQIYSMSAWDMAEMLFVYRKNRPMTRLRRSIDRIAYIAVSYLVSIAFPFIADLAGFFAGIGSVPATFAVPCFMFLALKKTKLRSALWYLNWALGILGVVLGIGFSTGAVYNLVKSGLKFHFFKPQG